jgi:hypothetical protein
VVAFIGGVYFYSIQAVKQEDFVSKSCWIDDSTLNSERNDFKIMWIDTGTD